MSNRKSATASKSRFSKRKSGAASKRARSPKVAARAQRNKQAVVKSRKESPLRLVAAGSTEAPIEVAHDPKPEALVVDNRARPAALEAILQASVQNDSDQKTADNNPRTGSDLFQSFANLQAYQAKLLEVAQANMQFAFEFFQRLATVRSPFVLGALLAEFTGRRIIMTAKHSKELAALWRMHRLKASQPHPH